MNILQANPLKVLSIGVDTFSAAIARSGGEAVSLSWSPPAGGDRAAARAIEALYANPAVDAANGRALAAFLASDPKLSGVGTASKVIPGMDGRTLLHSGPPIEWERMCGPVKGALMGAMLFEGWAKDLDGAKALAESGGVRFAPCHHHGAVGPMAGVISPSMPVWVTEDASNGGRTFSNFNEGLGKVLRFGANGGEVLKRLAWMRDVLAPACGRALAATGPIDLKPLMAQALHMGDEVHNRNNAATGLLLKRLLPGLLRAGLDGETVASVIEFMAGNDHFFLNISMTACKAMCNAAHDIPGSSMVTAMARNGVDFGIRVSGLGDRWFTAPAPVVDGLYFPGYSMADAAPDLGDSAITETAGVGGFAMAAAPAIVKFVNGTPEDALANTEEMGHVTLGRNSAFTLPMLNFAGTPTGIDLRLVVDTGILPVINTGIAHKEAGIGQIGAGVTRAPMPCFAGAAAALAEKLGGKGDGA